MQNQHLSHIALIGPPDRLQVWERRIQNVIKPDKVTLVQDANALTPDCSVCIYLPDENEDISYLTDLIRRGLHLLVINHPFYYLEHAETLWKAGEETGAEIWFSLWNLFQPGLIQLVERLKDPHHLLFNRNITADSEDYQSRLRQVMAEELLLGLYWTNSRIKNIITRHNEFSTLLHLETVSGKPVSVRISSALNAESVKRWISADSEAYFSKNGLSITSRIIRNSQPVDITTDPQYAAADLLLLSYIRAIRGLAHRPSFKLYDLFQHRSILRYI